MEAEQVIDKIISDAKAEADKLLKQAADKQAAEQADADQKLADYNEHTRSLVEKAAEDEKAHILAAARMQIAKDLLAEKRKVLDEVLDKARENVMGLPDDDYKKLMAKLIADAVETGDEEVILDAGETRLDTEFNQGVNHSLGPGSRGNLKLADQKLNLGAGFVLRRDKIKTNVSIDVLLDRARKDLEIELAKDLFSD